MEALEGAIYIVLNTSVSAMKGRKYFDWRAAAIFLVIVAIAGYAGSRWLNIPYWIAAIVTALALLVNGVIAVMEDGKDGL